MKTGVHIIRLLEIVIRLLFKNRALLKAIYREVLLIMATQTELAADLTAVKDQVAKIGVESSVTLQKVTDLEAVIAAGGGTSPEVDAALAALKTQVQLVDDLIPDAAP